MAKKSKIAKNERRQEIVARYAARRAELKEIIRRPSSTDADYFTLLAGWGYNLSDVEQIVTAGESANAEGDAASVNAEPSAGD